MSFSRWSEKNYFYTYHKSNSKNNSKLIEQIFAVSPSPKDTGEYVEFEIQYGSLKKENKRKEFVEKCIQFADEDYLIVLRDELNLLIDKFMKACEEDEDEYKYRK